MTSRRRTLAVLAYLATALFLQYLPRPALPTEPRAQPTLGNPQTLLTAYDRWKHRVETRGAERKLVLPLRYSQGLSTEFTKASGRATLDLSEGSLSVEVSGLRRETSHDVWLVDNRPGPGHSGRKPYGRIEIRNIRAQMNTRAIQLHPDIVWLLRHSYGCPTEDQRSKQ